LQKANSAFERIEAHEQPFLFAKHCRKKLEIKQKICIAFIDLLEDFDNVNWNVIMKILKRFKIDYKARKIIRQLCKHQMTCIKIKENIREATIRKGVKNGYNLSPLLFTKYIE